jgi:hypothetical protein
VEDPVSAPGASGAAGGGAEGGDLDARPDEAALFDLLFVEDELYDEDARLAARELPPRPWRVAQRGVDEVMERTRCHLDRAWRELREQVRRERMAAAIAGSFESRNYPSADQVSTTTSVSPEPIQLFDEPR